ncbi:hypothetical protein G6011_08083 [Alternaria panax]|uniref:Uncharacterized protein n=1 Tax=Alternaria panax TaxID=48097 RepID=A0AAD4FII2_9PLEO|nr:hypothetical protein G6011_08083 [Alternaria panax]
MLGLALVARPLTAANVNRTQEPQHKPVLPKKMGKKTNKVAGKGTRKKHDGDEEMPDAADDASNDGSLRSLPIWSRTPTRDEDGQEKGVVTAEASGTKKADKIEKVNRAQNADKAVATGKVISTDKTRKAGDTIAADIATK